jgi:3-hydroxymyristoyl/3-hydroxydecanoyl-(acyl carrier protein) dehydratase
MYHQYEKIYDVDFQNTVHKRIPHRYENILIDQIVPRDYAEDGQHRFVLDLHAGDRLNRDIFLKHRSKHRVFISVPAVLEFLALGSLLSHPSCKTNELVLFSSVSNFQVLLPARLGQTIFGTSSLIKKKAGFVKYHVKFLDNHNVILGMAEITGVISKLDHLAGIARNKAPDTENCSTMPLEKDIRVKSKWLWVIDRIIKLDIQGKTITTEYRYPENHPLTKGHFPNFKMMMGIMQWIGVEDALYAYANELKKSSVEGEYMLSCNTEIIREDGVVVTSQRGVKAIVCMSVDGVYDQVNIIKVAKCNFRQIVCPNCSVRFKISDISVHRLIRPYQKCNWRQETYRYELEEDDADVIDLQNMEGGRRQS